MGTITGRSDVTLHRTLEPTAFRGCIQNCQNPRTMVDMGIRPRSGTIEIHRGAI